ncbi:MAG: hypothetical protein J3Q66DRAFT_406359 [Benniella sp.]|nr:MAG: hypothetical protein J3Q66DRAFT_406359 [Benniella sp.]
MSNSTPLGASMREAPSPLVLRSNPQTFDPMTSQELWEEPATATPSRRSTRASRSPHTTTEISLPPPGSYHFDDDHPLFEMGHRVSSQTDRDLPSPAYTPYLYPSSPHQDQEHLPYVSPPRSYPSPPSPSRQPYPVQDSEQHRHSSGGTPLNSVTLLAPSVDRHGRFEVINHSPGITHAMDNSQMKPEAVHVVSTSNRKRIFLCRLCFFIIIFSTIIILFWALFWRKKDYSNYTYDDLDHKQSPSSMPSITPTTSGVPSPPKTTGGGGSSVPNNIVPPPPTSMTSVANPNPNPPVITNPPTVPPQPTNDPSPPSTTTSDPFACQEKCRTAFNDCMDTCKTKENRCKDLCRSDLGCIVNCGFIGSDCRDPCYSANRSCSC